MKRPKTPTFYTVELREVDGLYRAYVHALAVSCSASSPVRASSQIEHDLADVLDEFMRLGRYIPEDDPTDTGSTGVVFTLTDVQIEKIELHNRIIEHLRSMRHYEYINSPAAALDELLVSIEQEIDSKAGYLRKILQTTNATWVDAKTLSKINRFLRRRPDRAQQIT